MRRKKPSLSKKMAKILGDGHAEALQKSRRLQDLLTHLRFEGKASLGKNLAETKEVLQFFKREIRGHMVEEEKVIFPFLRTHLPRLEPLISFLCSEHEDFRIHVERFDFLLSKLVRGKGRLKGGALMDQLSDTAGYLTCLLQNHHREESEILYKVADRELRGDEKQELASRVRRGRSG